MNVQNSTSDLERRTEAAFEQLTRYGGLFSEEMVEILEILSNINDDQWHNRDGSLIRNNVAKIKDLLDIIEWYKI